jgi:hypothetical protein
VLRETPEHYRVDFYAEMSGLSLNNELFLDEIMFVNCGLLRSGPVILDKKKKVEAEKPEGAKTAPRAPKRSCICLKKLKSCKVTDVEMKRQIKEQQDKINSMDPENPEAATG